MQRSEGRSLAFETGLNYSLSAVGSLLLSLLVLLIYQAAAGEGYADTEGYRYLSYLLPQVSAFAAAVLFMRRTKVGPREIYRGCKWYYFPIALLLAFGLFSLSELNGLFTGALQKLGYSEPESTLPRLDGIRLLPALLVIAVLPAICEETFFRGVQVTGMRKSGWGAAASVFISGALFSLFHCNPAQTVYQFLCGVCYALVAMRAGSVFPTMLAHFANNAVVLSLTAAGYSSIVPAGFKVGFYLLSGASLAAALALLVLFGNKGEGRGVKDGKRYFLAAATGIAVCAAQWITLLAVGFA